MYWLNSPLIGPDNTTNTEIHDQTLSWLNTDTSITSGGIKLIICPPPNLTVKSCGQSSAIHMWVQCQPRENWTVIKNAIILNTIHNTFNLRDKDVVINVLY